MLNLFQKKIASYAITALSITVIAAFIILLLRALGLFLDEFYYVLLPVFCAVIISYIAEPAVIFMADKLGLSKRVSVAAIFSLAIVAIAVVAAVGLPYLIEQISNLIDNLPKLAKNASSYFAEKAPKLREAFQQVVSGLCGNFDASQGGAKLARGATKLAATATAEIHNIVALSASLAVVPIYLYYMLVAEFDFYKWLKDRTTFLPDGARETLIFFIRRFSEIMQSFFRGQLLIAAIMGLLLGTGLKIAGVKFGFMLGFSAGLLNIIPYFGTIIGLGTILPMAFFQEGGGIILCAVALGIFIVVQLIEGYILTPKIMGDKTGLHPTIIIFSVFFWGTALNGILGMILAIPFSAFVVAAYPTLQRWMAEKFKDKEGNPSGESENS